MDIKPYDLALYVGRFQPLHLGHISAIETALKICDRVLVVIGSAQESCTTRNPFDIQTRIGLIQEIFGDRVIVKPLVDMTDESDICVEWGKYLMDFVKRTVGKAPDVMVYGDEEIKGWFTKEEMKDTMRVVLPRQRIDISATDIRGFLLNGDRENFFKYTHSKTHKHFERLRNELLNITPHSIALKEEKKVEFTRRVEGYDYSSIDFEQEQNWA